MTSAALLQRAAELVIALGLDDADTTAQQVYASAERGDVIVVSWRVPWEPGKRAEVELTVRRRTDRLEAYVTTALGRMRADDAKRAHLMYGRVVDLASRIEALR